MSKETHDSLGQRRKQPHIETSKRRVNYDEVAPTYDQRYATGGPEGIASALLSLTRDVGAERVLEVGCGTGHWLAALQPTVHLVCGLDLSLGMLQKAQDRKGTFHLVCGHANQLPFPDQVFDIVLCVHALHHFDRPHAFVRDSRRLLRPGGALAIIGMDPHTGRDRWYLYGYFPGTYEADLNRYPSGGTIMDWMVAAGFDRVEWRVAARIIATLVGREILDNPFLQKNSTSQLTLLTHEAYAAGIARIEAALANAEAAGESLVFPVDISLTMTTGYVKGSSHRRPRNGHKRQGYEKVITAIAPSGSKAAPAQVQGTGAASHYSRNRPVWRESRWRREPST